MDDANDMAEDGSIPDLTEVNMLNDTGSKITKSTELPKHNHLQILDKSEEQDCTIHKNFAEQKQKLQNTRGKLCSDIKTALNTAHCFDNNEEKGRHISYIISPEIHFKIPIMRHKILYNMIIM